MFLFILGKQWHALTQTFYTYFTFIKLYTYSNRLGMIDSVLNEKTLVIAPWEVVETNIIKYMTLNDQTYPCALLVFHGLVWAQITFLFLHVQHVTISKARGPLSGFRKTILGFTAWTSLSPDPIDPIQNVSMHPMILLSCDRAAVPQKWGGCYISAVMPGVCWSDRCRLFPREESLSKPWLPAKTQAVATMQMKPVEAAGGSHIFSSAGANF